MTSTNIKISKNVKERIENFEDGGTMDTKLNNIIDIVEPYMPFVPYGDERTNIKTTTKTLERLDSFKITGSESRDNVMTRMLIILETLNKVPVVKEEWIPFKITNKYNNLLYIDGQLEYNSKEVSFNYRGHLYLGKLPSTYIVNGKDLTKEMYLWYDDLNWNTIINHLLQNKNSSKVIEEGSYILEINQLD